MIYDITHILTIKCRIPVKRKLDRNIVSRYTYEDIFYPYVKRGQSLSPGVSYLDYGCHIAYIIRFGLEWYDSEKWAK